MPLAPWLPTPPRPVLPPSRPAPVVRTHVTPPPQPPPGWPVAPAKKNYRRRRRKSSGGVVFLVIALCVGGAVRRVVLDGSKDTGKHAKQPAAWDTRVQQYVAFVERARGLTFTRPVEVDFLTEADYLDLFEPGDARTDPSDRAVAEQYADFLNAEGLTSGVDEGDTGTRVAQTASLGFYDFDSKRIFVRGDTLTPAVQVVLVHELTHALQAQHFDIELGGEDDLVLRSIVEGDAMRIEWKYADTLPGGQREQADADNTQDEQTAAELEQIPWALVQQTFAPYDLGPIFLQYLEAHGGPDAINTVFDNLPSEEELITPSLYGTGSADQPVDVKAPDGSAVLDTRSWPMFDALVMLDAWLPWLQARPPFDGWAGGSIVTYERGGEDGPVCFTAAAAFDSDAHAAGFATAVTAWGAAAASPVLPETAGVRVSFESCDRGDGAAVPPKPSFSTSEQAILESNLLAAGAEQGAAPATDTPAPGDTTIATVPLNDTDRRCIVRTMIDDPDLGPLFLKDTFTPEEDDILLLRSTIARNTCGVFP